MKPRRGNIVLHQPNPQVTGRLHGEPIVNSGHDWPYTFTRVGNNVSIKEGTSTPIAMSLETWRLLEEVAAQVNERYERHVEATPR